MNAAYVDTVRLLLAVAPNIFRSSRFALKGGTALNLFVQEMPRLSVDIDVVLTDHRLDRAAALAIIAETLAQAQSAIEAQGLRVRPLKIRQGDDLITQLPQRLTPAHRAFLLSLVRAEPDWTLMPFKHLRELPALQWKLLNLQKLRSTNPARFAQQQQELLARWHVLDKRTNR